MSLNKTSSFWLQFVLTWLTNKFCLSIYEKMPLHPPFCCHCFSIRAYLRGFTFSLMTRKPSHFIKVSAQFPPLCWYLEEVGGLASYYDPKSCAGKVQPSRSGRRGVGRLKSAQPSFFRDIQSEIDRVRASNPPLVDKLNQWRAVTWKWRGGGTYKNNALMQNI